jgi:hypothetical protein
MEAAAQSNNGMHPTRDTLHVIPIKGAGGRVMPGVGQIPHGTYIKVE